MTRRDIPNLLTVLRILLVPPFALALVDGRYNLALMLFLLAGASDGLDGFLAKRYGWTSRLGSILDPLADKLLLITSFLVLAWLELLPGWLAWAVLGRDVAIVAGALAYHWYFGRYDLAPAAISKVNTLVQIVLVVATITAAGPFSLIAMGVPTLVYLALATTLASGIHYVITWSQRALASRRVSVS